MNLKSSAAVAVMLGLTATATAAPAASPTCRDLRTGAADRVCRWQVEKGDFVNVYYGAPSPTAPPEPVRSEPSNAEPPAGYAAPVDYYGYALPFVVGADKPHAPGRDHGSRLLRGPPPVPSPTTAARPPTFHGGQGALQSGGFRAQGGGWRR